MPSVSPTPIIVSWVTKPSQLRTLVSSVSVPSQPLVSSASDPSQPLLSSSVGIVNFPEFDSIFGDPSTAVPSVSQALIMPGLSQAFIPPNSLQVNQANPLRSANNLNVPCPVQAHVIVSSVPEPSQPLPSSVSEPSQPLMSSSAGIVVCPSPAKRKRLSATSHHMVRRCRRYLS